MATIILTGGGTAGHCTPNIALLPYLKENFNKIVYVGSKNGIERNIVENEKLPYYAIPCAKLNRYNLKSNFTMPFQVFCGIINAGKILDKVKPDVVFSKGGYVAVPTVIAAAKRKIPVISHESDYSIGLANKLCAKYSKKVLTSFPETARTIKNGEHVGSPIRDAIFNGNKKTALKLYGFSGQKPIILVTGGSQGAKAINDNVRDALPQLLPKFDIIHICGKNNLMQAPPQKGYFQAEYINDINNAFAVCSLCISRAGSNTVFELMSLNIPTILIPLPKGTSRGDQILNAEYFHKLGLAHLLNQQVLTKESLILAINSVYSSRRIYEKNFKNNPIENASEKISKIIASYAH